MSSSFPEIPLPRLWCDFNALGWSGAPDDTCYYAFDQKALAALSPTEGQKLLAYDDDGACEVIGCEARLESHGESWRIRPDYLPRRISAA
jgi:hypothetical protein